MFSNAEVISVYTRKQAIEDGVLIDVTKTATEAGFCLHTVVTQAVWNECVAWSDKDSKRQTHQDESGRLWDVLFMATIAARIHHDSSEVLYKISCVPRGGRGRLPRTLELKLNIGPGDNGESVITIMLPDES